MEILWKDKANRPKLCGNYAFLQEFHTRKLQYFTQCLLLHPDFNFMIECPLLLTSTTVKIQNTLDIFWYKLNLNNNVWDFVRKTWSYPISLKLKRKKWVTNSIKSFLLPFFENHTKNLSYPRKKWCFKLCFRYHNTGKVAHEISETEVFVDSNLNLTIRIFE